MSRRLDLSDSGAFVKTLFDRRGVGMKKSTATVSQFPVNTAFENQFSPSIVPKDYFIQRNGVVYAGTHLIIDVWNGKCLDDLQLMEQAMREMVETCGATLLHIHLHHFTPNGGVSGVAVLAESHISVHTWPEKEFAAFDIFMCGAAKPEKSVPVLKKYFETENVSVTELLRGESKR